MIKVCGNEGGLCFKQVLWCLDELDLPFQRLDAKPGGIRPALFSDDLHSLAEPQAVLGYLVRKYAGASLMPATPRAGAEAARWLDWSAAALWPDTRTVVAQWLQTAAVQRDQGRLQAASARLEENWAVVDAQLACQSYLAGAFFGLADISFGIMAHTWIEVELEGRPSLPHFNAWYDRIAARPGFRRYAAVHPDRAYRPFGPARPQAPFQPRSDNTEATQ
jgi:glutathione S-transferase